MNADRKSNKAISAVIIVVLLGILAGGGAYIKSGQSPKQTVQNETQMASDSDKKSSKKVNAENYKDGEYAATGSYDTPGGREKIKIAVTISGNKVTKTKATSMADEYSATERYQEEFIGGYKKEVVGKSVNDIKLDRVAGSSLTSNGFNMALEMIKQDAAA